MKKANLWLLYVTLILPLSLPLYSQQLSADGGILLNAEITLGNQNQSLKLGLFGFGALNYGDLSIESGISLGLSQLFKRHTIKEHGIGYYYELFALGGIGKNTNLLGSSVSSMNTNLIVNANGNGGFNGLGFGVSKEVLPKSLKSYDLRRGALHMRFSNANHSMHLTFLNDFKIGWFKGAGTDYGVTGSLAIGFSKIQSIHTAYQVGFGLDLFTPRPDYSQPPRSQINSDDGRKNVWFTLPPYTDLFYGNIYGYGSYQKEYYATHMKFGMNSPKAGAYIQNKLHDGLGLNPRFPWNVESNDKLFIEVSGNGLLKNISDD